MKKVILFLMTILGFLVVNATNVEAATNFYEADYVSGVWMTKDKGKAHLYQTARFFRRTTDGKAAYCLEPFLVFNDSSTYNESLAPDNLSTAQKDRISKIAYYGYGENVPGHRSNLWYAVSQLMIWQTTEPGGDFYFTDSLNGNRVNWFDSYINEINNYINHHYDVPSFSNSEIVLEEDNTLTLTDSNRVLQNFKSDNPNAVIDGNNINISGLTEGEYTINLTKTSTGDPVYFFNHPTSQNLMTSGAIDSVSSSFKIIVKKTTVEINKIDKDTNSTTPSGEGKLEGATYELYDDYENLINTIEFDETLKTTINNLKFGKYFLKEIKAGTGYTIDEKVHEFTIDKDNTIVNLQLSNTIIKKKLELFKKYGEDTSMLSEPGIVFNIYNNKGEFVTSITTNNDGYANVELPFGNYTVKQATSTEGYQKVEDFKVSVTEKEEDKLKFELFDYIIKVPNTLTESKFNYLVIIFLIISGIIYAKKEKHL